MNPVRDVSIMSYTSSFKIMNTDLLKVFLGISGNAERFLSLTG